MRGFRFVITTAVYVAVREIRVPLTLNFFLHPIELGTEFLRSVVSHISQKNERDVGHPGVVERETTASGCSLLPEHCQRRFYKTYGVGHTGMPRGGTGHLRRVIG